MSFTRTRSDGKEVEIVSINNANLDYYQWGKNCANLEQTEDEIKNLISKDMLFSPDTTSEQADEFWRGFLDNQIPSQSN